MRWPSNLIMFNKLATKNTKSFEGSELKNSFTIKNHAKIWRDFMVKEINNCRTYKKLGFFMVKEIKNCRTYKKLGFFMVKDFIQPYKKLGFFILDALFPIECINCKTEGDFICKKCQEKITINRTQTCPKCHTPSEFGKFCATCRAGKNFDGVLAVSDYKDRLTELIIKKYKYNFLINLSNNLAGLLASFFYQEALIDDKIFSKFFTNEILIIPVPLHKKRLNWRGFNQSEEVAKKFATNFDFVIDRKNLIKKTHTRPQAKLKGAERLDNLKNCFEWQGEKIMHKCVLLIDDVSTTGSTLNECALALKNAGAKNIWAIVLAKGG